MYVFSYDPLHQNHMTLTLQLQYQSYKRETTEHSAKVMKALMNDVHSESRGRGPGNKSSVNFRQPSKASSLLQPPKPSVAGLAPKSHNTMPKKANTFPLVSKGKTLADVKRPGSFTL